MRTWAAVLCGLILGAGTVTIGQDAPEANDPEAIPPAFSPFRHLIGAWKGQAMPITNRLKGWPERHLWAYTFENGHPTGMAITFEGSKTLQTARLRYDAPTKTYRLDGTDAAGKPVVYAGPIDDERQVLHLERTPPPAGGGVERLTLRLNSNLIRYTWLLETRAPRATRFTRAIDANLGKEGESFAAGGSESNLPECVMTGGAATMSVTYNGKSYPLCCSGCRDEFLANPEKYAAKAAKRAENKAKGKDKDADQPKPRPGPSSDDAFDGLVEDPKGASA